MTSKWSAHGELIDCPHCSQTFDETTFQKHWSFKEQLTVECPSCHGRFEVQAHLEFRTRTLEKEKVCKE